MLKYSSHGTNINFVTDENSELCVASELSDSVAMSKVSDNPTSQILELSVTSTRDKLATDSSKYVSFFKYFKTLMKRNMVDWNA